MRAGSSQGGEVVSWLGGDPRWELLTNCSGPSSKVFATAQPVSPVAPNNDFHVGWRVWSAEE